MRFTLALVAALAVALAGCAQPDSSAPASDDSPFGGQEPTQDPADDGTTDGAGAPAMQWRDHEFLGRILADGDGRTLYVFTRDPAGASVCAGGCAAAWPPVSPDNASAEGDLAARVTTIDREDGGRQLALDGRPLYLFVGDAAPGDADGQGRNGVWFVVRESDAPGQLNVDFLDGPGEHEVEAGNVTFGDGHEGYLAAPADGEGHPGVVMVHEWWGLNDHVRTMARALASHGYAVLAVDLFGQVATTPEAALAQVRALEQDAATAEMRAAAQHLRTEGASRVASLGWCFGGGQSLQLALSGEPLNATVIYYGNLVNDTERLGAIDWPVLGVFGAQDTSIPVAAVRDFEAALDEAGVPHEIHVYEDVGHAFANPSGQAYGAREAMDAWAKTLAFLAENLQP